MDPVEKIAEAVLYEGYVLYPYRHSSVKNQRRWTFGGVYPPTFSRTSAGNDPHTIQTQVLVTGDGQTRIGVKVRFLQVVGREVNRFDDGSFLPVDELRVGGQLYRPWDEAAERSVALEGVTLGELASGGRSVEIDVPGETEEEPLLEASGEVAGSLVRGWHSLAGRVEVRAEPLEGELFKVTVRVSNTTPWEGGDREDALKRTFVSTHAILRVAGGEFVSLLEPPREHEAAAGACRNEGVWPVLVGEEDRSAMLASPIILYDYPQIAPESPGDLFDGTEIDEILTLRIMTLTDEEKQEMRESDPRAREILARTEALTPDDFMKLHGAIRGLRVLDEPFAAWEQEAGSKLQSVEVGDTEVRKGSRVILRPWPGGDVMDLALAGKVAIVEAVEQDYENRVHLAVTIEDDPGRDLGDERQPGHRFFFSAEEVEPL